MADVIRVSDVSMMFSQSAERIDSLKEYVIRAARRELHFRRFWALRNVSFALEKGESLGIVGLNGSGKSTLLRCLNQLETVDSGTIVLDGLTLCRTLGGKLTYADPATLRRITLKMGMVFQSYNLFPHMSVMQNLTDAPMRVKRLSRAQATERARELLAKVGLSDKADQYPYQLSGGQQQRVAIARALATKPAIVLADEPTGNLDSKTSQDVLGLMKVTSQRFGQTMVMITHNEEIAQLADRVVRIEDGRIVTR